MNGSKGRRIAVSSLFGVIIFIEKALLPPIFDKSVSALLQMFFLSLAFLMTGLTGPILTGFVSGLLTATIRSHLGWMTFTFALLYGVLVGGLYRLLGVVNDGEVRAGRLIYASLASTMVVAALSASTAILLGIIPYDPRFVVFMMFAGAVQGVVGGFLSHKVYEKYVRKIFT